MLALTFVNKEDYNKVQERDKISVIGLNEFAPGRNSSLSCCIPMAQKIGSRCLTPTTSNRSSGLCRQCPECDEEIINQRQRTMQITKEGERLKVPDRPVIPFIEGDGIGKEITPHVQQIIDAAVAKAYSDSRRIEWREVLAGEKAFNAVGSWLPEETMEAFRTHMVKSRARLPHPSERVFVP